jgi:hypothetical protein
MRRMLLYMLATGSLTALSAAISQGRLVRSAAAAASQAAQTELERGAAAPAPRPIGPTAPGPARILPRGSLLDLAV